MYAASLTLFVAVGLIDATTPLWSPTHTGVVRDMNRALSIQKSYSACHNTTSESYVQYTQHALRSIHADNADDEALVRALYDVCVVDTACRKQYKMSDENDDTKNYLIFRYLVTKWLDVKTASFLQPLHELCDPTPVAGLRSRAISASPSSMETLINRVWLLEMRVQACSQEFSPCKEYQRFVFDIETGVGQCACDSNGASPSHERCHQHLARAHIDPINYSTYAAVVVIVASIFVCLQFSVQNALYMLQFTRFMQAATYTKDTRSSEFKEFARLLNLKTN